MIAAGIPDVSASSWSADYSGLHLRVLRSLDELVASRAPWSKLVNQLSDATPFQTWEWVVGFARYEQCEPRVFVLEGADGRWAGVLPLCEHASIIPGHRRLELIGGRLSDFPGLLVDPGCRSYFESHLRQALSRLAGCSSAYIRSQAATPGWLPALRYKVIDTEQSVSITLAASVAAMKLSLPSRFRKNLRRDERLLAGRRVDYYTPEEARSFRAAMAILYRLHQQRKNAKGERGRFYDPAFCSAMTDVATALYDKKVARLTVMRIDGEAAAASLDLRLHGRQYSYQDGMNPRFNRFSPGKMLMLRMIEEAIADGMTSYNLGRGMEPYKLQWGRECQCLQDLFVTRSASLLEVEAALQRLRSALMRSRLLKRAYLNVHRRRLAGMQ